MIVVRRMPFRTVKVECGAPGSASSNVTDYPPFEAPKSICPITAAGSDDRCNTPSDPLCWLYVFKRTDPLGCSPFLPKQDAFFCFCARGRFLAPGIPRLGTFSWCSIDRLRPPRQSGVCKSHELLDETRVSCSGVKLCLFFRP